MLDLQHRSVSHTPPAPAVYSYANVTEALLLNRLRYKSDDEDDANDVFNAYISTENEWGFNADNYCSENYKGPLCQLCSSGHYKKNAST